MDDGRKGGRSARPAAGAPAAGVVRADGVVRAAGGVVVRRSPQGHRQIAVIHRPARRDWSFPKGKLEPGEQLEDCARREVLEETGLLCHLGRFLGRTEYRDAKDRRKVVSYWLMHPEAGRFTPNEEVDELRWVDLDTAERLLTYDRDRELAAVAAAPAG